MPTYKLGVMRGDGIGLEIVQACLTIFERALQIHTDVTCEVIECPMGLPAIRQYGSALPDKSRELLKTCDAWIMGPHDNASYPEEERKKHRNPSGELRHSFDLYANIRPSHALPGIHAVAPEMDIVIVRENTEEFYPDRNMVVGSGECMPTPDLALCTGVFTRRAATRIARTAFEMAQRRRQHVTLVHKANVITLGYGLFLQACREVAKDYPNVRVDDYHVDAMAAHLVRRSADFDVLVTTNMLGDILSDLAGELAGSLGLSPSINASDTTAMAQAVHGSAPDIAGKGIANPTGITLSLVMLLDWLAARHKDTSLLHIARSIEHAIQQVYQDGVRTADVGGNASTDMFTNAVVERLL